mgnify:CR=1 FL=1
MQNEYINKSDITSTDIMDLYFLVSNKFKSIDEAVELDAPVKSLTPTFADIQLLEATENSEGEPINANLDSLPQEANDFDFDFSDEDDDDPSFF